MKSPRDIEFEIMDSLGDYWETADWKRREREVLATCTAAERLAYKRYIREMRKNADPDPFKH